jgi:hypothetical protein
MSSWDGKERRRDYPDISERLTRLETLQEEDKTDRITWRKSLCDKIDKIFSKLEGLPCRERGEMYRGLRMREALMWGAIGIVTTLLFIHLGWR